MPLPLEQSTGVQSAEVLRGTIPLDAFLDRSATLAVASVDAHGTIASTNRVFERLVGSPPSLREAFAQGQYGVIAQLLESAGDEWRSARAGLRALDGESIDCEVSVLARRSGIVVVAEPLHAPADRLNDHLLELNDDLLAARRELADRNRKLRELDELKNMFIASASHDLKTPMTSILGYAELLNELELDDDARPMVATIERNAKRLVSMIDDLLGAALVMTGELRLMRADVDLARIVRESVAMIEPVATEGGLTVELECAEHAIARLDAGRILQILDNLLSNAVKYSPDGGRLSVTCTDGADEVTVAVTDSGIGISSEEQAKLFGRFFRATTARDHGIAGTGLGLANARAFAEAHRGSLTCTSEAGVGSTFTLVLPKGGEQQ